MKAERFRGATVALITPFNKDGALDVPALQGLVDWQVEQGTDCILVAGTTGEAVTLSQAEHQSITERVVERVRGRCPVICGTGTNSTSKSRQLTQVAEACGCDAVLAVCPYYNKPTQEGFYRHFQSIAEATRLPLILYNVPSRTGSNMSAETTLRLAQNPQIVGIKEASGNLSQIMTIIRKRPENFLVLSGDDSLTLPLIALGGDGVISVVANQVPRLFSNMVTAALENRWEEARDLHYRLLPLMEVNFIESNPIPVKAALAMMGKIREEYRLPLVKISEGSRMELRRVLEEQRLV